MGRTLINRKGFLKGLAAGVAVASTRDALAAASAGGDGAARISFLGTSHGSVTPLRFSSCTLLQYGGKNYVIDAADGAVSRLMQTGVKAPDLDAVFITHPHSDHFGGLPMLLVQHGFQNLSYRANVKVKKPVEVLLPGPELEQTIRAIHDLAHFGKLQDCQHLKAYRAGVIFDDGNVKVTAYGNDHMGRRADGTQFAHSLLIELSNGRRIYFSGDVNKDFDLPLGPFDKGRVDLLVCELVHYPIAKAVERLKGRDIAKICFQHYGDGWEAPGWQERFAAFALQLGIPSERVTDLDVRYV
ncbi:MAG TPA: MBL fold metallo-hydrolase [Kiritimatiellia bacterium]|nr:MBL fold metallo-hydrolase [Kiritimatiellia bacterium]HPS06276.1 MBL fold metallo-hydrolase [Kiritimatiellia bacterium]